MTRRALLAPRARAEFLELLRRVGDENPAAAERLRLSVQKAAFRLGEHPLLGRVEASLARPRYRFWSIPDFSVLLVYDSEIEPVEILRIVHTARDLPKLLKDVTRL